MQKKNKQAIGVIIKKNIKIANKNIKYKREV